MTDLDILAFIDESKMPRRDAATGNVTASGDDHVVAAAIVLRGDTMRVRNQIRDLLAAVGHDLHYTHMSGRRRSTALAGIAAITDWDGLVYETATAVATRRPEQRTRARCPTPNRSRTLTERSRPRHQVPPRPRTSRSSARTSSSWHRGITALQARKRGRNRGHDR